MNTSGGILRLRSYANIQRLVLPHFSMEDYQGIHNMRKVYDVSIPSMLSLLTAPAQRSLQQLLEPPSQWWHNQEPLSPDLAGGGRVEVDSESTGQPPWLCAKSIHGRGYSCHSSETGENHSPAISRCQYIPCQPIVGTRDKSTTLQCSALHHTIINLGGMQTWQRMRRQSSGDLLKYKSPHGRLLWKGYFFFYLF